MSSPRNVIANFAALVNITIDSAPSGRAIVVDNVGFTAPQTFQWQPGTNHTIATSSPQFGLTGTRYLFSAWSDGGAISHAITVPATAATYTANFATHYELTTAVFPAGAGTVSPATGGYYAAGQVVPVSATGSGNAFINWTGPVASPTNPSSTVIMNGPVSVIANFTTPTTLTLNSSSNPSVFGQQVTLTATVTPASATGKVTFYDGVAVLGAATVSNGAAVLQTSLLEAGNHNLKAFYTGDSSHTPGNSSTLQQNVSTVPQNGFQPAVNYVAGVNSYAVAVADFNNDGRSDVAVTNSANSTVGVLLGTGDGVFAAAINSSLGAANTLFIVAADLNEDGITDLITGGSTTISVLLGAGNGSFQAPVLYTTGSGSQTSSIVAADFNKDGHVDLAVVNYGGSTISVLQGRGDGTLQAAVNYSVPVTPISLAAADFNSDGNTDLAVGSPAGNLTLLLGSGTGTFQSGSSYNTGFEAEHIGIADFNGDGRPDVAVASFPESGVKILLGNGNGTLQAPVLYGAGLRPFFLEIGDFNGDGKSDVAVTHSEPTTVNILFGNGDGTLNTGIAYNVGDLARIAAAGEFNGDGVTDLAVATIGGLRILLGVPATRTITINTAPAGLGFSVDNVSYSGTQTFEWVIGSTHTIAVTSPQAGAIGTRYVFANWSDGGATSHTVTGPATATTYTANFTTQYLLTTSTIPDGVGGVNADPPSADGYYDSGANVQLGAAKTAFKSAQYLFTGWSGDLTGTVSPQSIVMSSPRNVTVNYALAVTVVINTEPAGLSFVVDSDTLTTPIKATWIVGSNHTIAVTSPQAGSNGTQYVFANWSDGGAMSHTVTVPATGTTYTANFTEHIGSVEGISTVTMTIPSKAGPWSPTLNPTLDYGVHDNAAPVVVDASSGIVLTPGSTLTVTYRSGTVQAGAGYPIVDANGEPGNVTNSCIGNCFPAVHMNPGPDVFSMKLVGAFANNGIVVGKPFPIGNGPTALTVPAGANQLLLGINDNFYSDNSGSLSVAIAVTTTVLTVPSTAGPWSPTLNPSFNYGVHDNTAPVIVDASIGILLTPGSTLTVTYRGGTVQAGAGYPIVDANGEPGNVTNTCSGNCFPAVHMNPGPDVFSMKLVGTFANNGIIVGKPFPIGNGPTALTVPAGANQLLLGINDNFYSDNSGSLTVAVAVTGVTPIIPSKAGPWSPTLNPALDYGVHDNTPPVVIDLASGIPFIPGSTVTVTYRSGTVQAGAGYPIVDANGEPGNVTNSCTGNCFPAVHMNPGPDVFSMKLVGAFASNGIVVGKPFPIGNGPTALTVPAGANQLLLGINDNFYGDNSGFFMVTVALTMTPTTTTVTPSVNPSSFAQAVTFAASVSPSAATGTVQFQIDGADLGSPVALSNGQAISGSISTLVAGNHTITAAYSGDSNFLASSGTATNDVLRAPTTATLAVNLATAVYGQMVGLTATVTSPAGVPVGTVTFYDFPQGAPSTTLLGSSPVNSSGQASLTVLLSAGAHTVYAVMGSSANFSQSNQAQAAVSISIASTSTSLISSPNPSNSGQTVNFAATVTGQYGGPVTGTVTFKRGTNTVLGTAALVNGSATLPLSTLGVGPHSVTAVYGGDANDAGSASAAITQNVVVPFTTNSTISSSANPSLVTRAVTFTAVVTSTSPGTPTGTVTFMSGGITVLGTSPLSGGQAILSTSSLPAGSSGITAVYNGDPQFAGSTSPSLNQVVNKGTSTTVLTSTLNPSNVGQTVRFNVLLSCSTGFVPTGTVSLKQGNTVIATVSSPPGPPLFGTISLGVDVSSLKSGNNNLKAVYGGDAYCAGSTSNTVQQVVR
jgi:hypothetical protein